MQGQSGQGYERRQGSSFQEKGRRRGQGNDRHLRKVRYQDVQDFAQQEINVSKTAPALTGAVLGP